MLMNIITKHLAMDFFDTALHFADKNLRKAALEKAKTADYYEKKGKRRAYRALAVLGTIAEVCLVIGLLLPLSVPIGFLECMCPINDKNSLN